MKTWTIHLWDGHSHSTFQRQGSYEQVTNSMAGSPPGHIWSIC